LVKFQLVFTKLAVKDAQKLASEGLKPKAQKLLEVLSENPFQNPPPYETSPWEGQVGLPLSLPRVAP
jgi:Txe/YoeB family toxin of Txe-Axe toxin-antitoxin module